MKLAQLVNSKEQLKRLMSQPLRPSIAMRLRLFSPKYDEVMKPFEQTKLELLQKHGTSDEQNSGVYSITQADIGWESFSMEYREVLEEEVTIEVPTLKIRDIEVKGVRISADDLAMLDWLIKDEAA